MADPIKTAKSIFDQFLSKADPASISKLGHPPVGEHAQVLTFMAQIGTKGGKIGGKRRLETMTAKERGKIARKAAKARWAKRTQGSISKH
jgi:hypothetical protein